MCSPITHASIAFIAKSKVRKIPLWLLLLCTLLIDLLSILFLSLGVEFGAVTRLDFNNGWTYLKPAYTAWSHGLLMSIAWSVLTGIIVFLFYRDRRTSLVTGLMVFSHWILDFIVYNNLYIFFKGSPQIGLGLVVSPVGV